MTSPNATMLQSVQNFIGIIREQYPQDEDGSENLILVLSIFKHVLKRRQNPQPPSLEWIQTMKHSVRQAGNYLYELISEQPELMQGWYWTRPAENHAQELANLLCDLVLHVGMDVATAEAEYPEFKETFDLERANYRQMQNEADAALQKD